MRSFRGIMVRGCVIILFLVLLNGAGHFLYESVTDGTYFSVQELKEKQGSIETILIGTSLMQRGINPDIVSEALDTTCFNLGSSAQPLAGTYYLLKDQLDRNPVERVFMTVSVKSFMSDEDSKSTTAKLRVFDLIQSPVIKLQFMTDVGETAEYERFLFFPARVEDKISAKIIKRNISYRQSEEYENRMVFPGAFLKYYGMGFMSNEQEYNNSHAKGKIVTGSVWNRENILEENLSAIRKIADICREKGVEFNLVVLPHSEEYASKQRDLSDMDVYLEELCKDMGAGLYNYNYTAYEGIYEYVDNSCFMDRTHLNAYGATRMADLLCRDYQE